MLYSWDYGAKRNVAKKKWRAGNWGREGTTLLLPSLPPGTTQLASLINFSTLRFFSLHYPNCGTWSQAILQTNFTSSLFIVFLPLENHFHNINFLQKQKYYKHSNLRNIELAEGLNGI